MFRWLVYSVMTVLMVRPVQAQLTRVIDPGNPVTTDALESGGGSWIDINHDGNLDLFVANGNLTNQNNALYLNRGNGSFVKVTTGVVVTDGGSSIGGTWGDYDHDGAEDLFVTNRNNFGNFLYRGTGDTALTKITGSNVVTDIANSNSGSWVDVDGDGNLNLFVINFQGNNFCYRNSGAPDYLFTRIDTLLPVMDGSTFSIHGVWADMNNDRLPDLFIGNAGSQNDVLFTNHGNWQFSADTIPDGRSTLGASWGDYDNNGYLDLFAANYLGQANQLYRNSGPPNYTLVAVDTGVVSTDLGQSVGSAWGDFDNDGDLDLFVANDGENNFLYVNNGPPNYSFTKVSTGAAVSDGGTSFGCVWGDYDNDGALDLFVANRLNHVNFLYHNDGNSNHWLEIRCRGTVSNRSAIGAVVHVKALINGVPTWQRRDVVAQTGYNSQNLELHFGLGNAAAVDSIIVDWPSGNTGVFTGQPLDVKMIIGEDGVISEAESSTSLGSRSFTLRQNFPNPFNPSTTIGYEIPRDGFVSLKIFNMLGQEVATLVHRRESAGRHEARLQWPSSFSSGVYVYRLEFGGAIQCRKLIFLK